MKTVQYVSSLCLGLLFVFLAFRPVSAAQLEDFTITLGDTRVGNTGSYTFGFDFGTTGDIQQISFLFCKGPSGTCQPSGNQTVDTTTAAKGAGAWVGITKDEWSVLATTPREPKVQHIGSGEGVTDGVAATISLSSIENNDALNECQSAIPDTDTCYVRVTTYSDLGTTAIDTGVGSYTLVSDIVVSAQVDPLFTFRIALVSAGAVHNAITASETSSYSTLPFGNLTANTPKYVAHQLNVTTNTPGGYAIYNKLAQQMTGVYAGNNIDPFLAPAGTPTTWTAPTGNTPNTDTGWIGYNTTDTDVAGAAYTAGKFGAVSSAAQGTVMQGSASDPGTSAIYVSYGIEANVFQPADTYTGKLMYIALPTY